MSDDEGFLARWSRRKRDAAATPPLRPPAKPAEGDAAAQEPAPSRPPEEPPPPFDLASLPPIESIGAGSDLRPFLSAGVPAALTRAALRRAWTADPAIRDFIGLSENSWDFNAPDGAPGFGPLTAEESRRLAARAGAATEPLDPTRPAAGRPAVGEAPAQGSADDRTTPTADPAPRPEPGDIATPAQAGDQKSPRRRHGGALPA